MKPKIGVWIDHKKAVIVSSSDDGVTAKTVDSGVEGHPRHAGQQDGGGEKKYDARHTERLDQYYDRVIGELGQPEALLILGPGEAKLELKDRLDRARMPLARTVNIETTDKLTDGQIVERVKAHFRIAR
jgi:hypothetical protein